MPKLGHYEPVLERFWRQVNQLPGPDACWVWTGYLQRYGLFNMPGRQGGKVRPHRFIWEHEHGPLSPGEKVLHRCDNPACVRPSHLFKGTQRDNMADCARKGRNRHSALTEADVVAIRASPQSYEKLGRQYGVTGSAIRFIKKRWTWKHVA